jgi:uncharacterized OsmC-like protein
MVKMNATYIGNLKMELEHEPSSSIINVSAPKDNFGDGSTFSPTDLFAVSYLTCMMTIMAIFGKNKGIELNGMSGSVEKHMLSNPRRIGKIIIRINIPLNLDENTQKGIIQAGINCPVAKSVHPDLETDIAIGFNKHDI